MEKSVEISFEVYRLEMIFEHCLQGEHRCEGLAVVQILLSSLINCVNQGDQNSSAHKYNTPDKLTKENTPRSGASMEGTENQRRTTQGGTFKNLIIEMERKSIVGMKPNEL